ncbi:MAG: metallophosphoesterase, partial [Clostridiales Family XIII bacterium]|nr:metallophosphoesterase [Clostridiales Family XIII bacterium]
MQAVSWLHISDLHYDPEAENYDTTELRRQLKDYLQEQQINVDCVIYAGDFRYAGRRGELCSPANGSTDPAGRPQVAPTDDQQAADAAKELIEIAQCAGVMDPANIHIVPGNHDLDRIEAAGATPHLDSACAQYDGGSFAGKIPGTGDLCQDYLLRRFGFFERVAAHLGNDVWVDMAQPGKPLHHVRDCGCYRIALLNTAIACGRDGERGRLVIGCTELANAFKAFAGDGNKPTIAIGHHGIDNFHLEERGRIQKIFYQNDVAVYLCGDAHLSDGSAINEVHQITAGCLKSAHGTEATFYVGGMDDTGEVSITAHQFTRHGWQPAEALTKEVARRLPKTHAEGYTNEMGTSLIGRDEKIREIVGYIENHKSCLVEVSGAGGIGKTSICEAVMQSIQTAKLPLYARGLGLEQLQIHLLRELGVHVAEQMEPIQLREQGIHADERISSTQYEVMLLNAAKKHGNKLLYIDNAESPYASNGTYFTSWLADFQRLTRWKVMYSTQKTFSLGDVEPFTILPLEEEDAAALFAARRGTIADQDQDTARHIACVLCSGIPLAIRLATSKEMNNKSLQRLAKELKEHKPPKQKDDPNNPHSSYSASLNLAISEISKDKNALILWSFLAMYNGTLNDDLFDRIFGTDDDDDSLARLRGYSILEDYTMYTPIKEASREFEMDIHDAAFTKLSSVFGQIFEEADSGNEKQQAFLRQDYGSIMAGIFGFLKWYIDLTKSNDAIDETRVDRLGRFIRGAANYHTESPDDAQKALSEAVAIFRTTSETHTHATILKMLGDLSMRRDDLDGAARHYADAEKIYRDIGANLGLANTLQALGDLAMRRNDLDDAARRYADAEKIFRDIGDNLGLANTLEALGDLSMRRDDLDGAARRYADAEKIYRDIGANLGLANTLKALGDLAMRRDDLDGAARHYADAEKIYREINDDLGIANTLKARGDLTMRRDQLDDAACLYDDAEKIYREINDDLGIANTLKARGDLAMRN